MGSEEKDDQEAPNVPQMPAGDAVEGGTSLDPDPGGAVTGPDKISAEDTPPEAAPDEEGEER